MRAQLVSFVSIGIAAFTSLGAAAAPATPPLPQGTPEEVGMSS